MKSYWDVPKGNNIKGADSDAWLTATHHKDLKTKRLLKNQNTFL